MLRGIFRVRETPGGFDDDFGADARPVEFGGIFDRENLDPPRSDDDAVAFDAHVLMQRTKYRVVFRKVGESGGIGEIVNGDEFDFRIVQGGANDIAADAAEAVDTYFHGHATGVSP